MTRAEGPLQAGSMDSDDMARTPPSEDRSDGGAWIGLPLAQFENSPRMLNGPIQQARRNSTRPSIRALGCDPMTGAPPGGGPGSVPEGVGARHLNRPGCIGGLGA